MRLFLLLVILTTVSAESFAQVSDFIKVVKRNNRTLKTYFPGSTISLQTVYGNNIFGTVQAIRNDSVYVKEYDIRSVPNRWGVASVDTLGTYVVGVHYKDIDLVVMKKGGSFGFIKNGSLMTIGGLGYVTLNLLNGKYLKESISNTKNMKTLGIALGVAGAGLLLNRLQRHNNRNGKKYRVKYVDMKTPSRINAF